MNTDSETKKPGFPKRLVAWFGGLPRWSKILFGVATGFVALGLVAAVFEDSPAPVSPPADHGTSGAPATSPTPGSVAPSGFVSNPGQPSQTSFPSPQETQTVPTAMEDAWSAGFFRLGFSFFAGFSMGLALRSITRLVIAGIGIGLLFLMALNYFELITVHWDAFDSIFENLGQRISGEAERFQSFITGSLPSAGLAATGLAAGIRGRR